MKHLKDPLTPINKFANSTKFFGIILMLGGGIALLSYRLGATGMWDLYQGLMLHIATTGIILVCGGEMLWKILKRNSDVTQRQFYFFDEK